MGEREFQTHDNQIQLMVHGIICAKIYPHSNTPNGNDNNNDKSFGSPVNGNDRISLSFSCSFPFYFVLQYLRKNCLLLYRVPMAAV